MVLDTNILIDDLIGIHEAKDEVLRFEKGCISGLTWMEVLMGLRHWPLTLVEPWAHCAHFFLLYIWRTAPASGELGA